MRNRDYSTRDIEKILLVNTKINKKKSSVVSGRVVDDFDLDDIDYMDGQAYPADFNDSEDTENWIQNFKAKDGRRGRAYYRFWKDDKKYSEEPENLPWDDYDNINGVELDDFDEDVDENELDENK